MSGASRSRPIAIVPEPAEWRPGAGQFVLGADTAIVADAGGQGVARYLRDLLALPTGLPLPVRGPSPGELGDSAIVLSIVEGGGELGTEGYVLRVSERGITLTALAPAGLFYGVQTLRQLLPVEVERRELVSGVDWSVPCLEVRDAARFPWRGHMLDEGRHFFGVEAAKRTLDLLAMLKMNVFHWHLTEDQGWRIEIQQYPRLTEVGAWRAGTQAGGYLSARQDDRPHGGYYTQDDLREVVDYAAERFITVVPEIEMPGHCTAALAAYPELSCRGEPIEVATRFGIHKEIFCAGKERTYAFLEGVLDEVLGIFPSATIHVGGDEVRKTRWKSCPDCQARMRAEELERLGELQAYFVQRMAAYLASQGRRLMGWNQILHDDLAPEAICQYWAFGMGEVLEHVRRGRDVVMSPVLKTYLDYGYDLTPLRQAYAFEPIPSRLEAEHHGHVLGLEAPLWTEFVPTLDRLDWQSYPRLTALAEAAWSPAHRRDYVDFRGRLPSLLERMDALGVRYARPEEVDPGFLRCLAGPFAMLVGHRRGPGGVA